MKQLLSIAKITLWVWLGWMLAQQAVASSYRQLTISEVIDNSALIIEGQVEGVRYEVPAGSKQVYTLVTIKILDLLKGTYLDKYIELRYPGGVLNGDVEYVADMQIPKVGEHSIFFVKSLTEHFVHPLTGWSQGEIKIVRDLIGGQQVYSAQGAPIKAIRAVHPSLNVKSNATTTPDVALGVVTAAPGGTGLSLEDAKQQLRQLIR